MDFDDYLAFREQSIHSDKEITESEKDEVIREIGKREGMLSIVDKENGFLGDLIDFMDFYISPEYQEKFIEKYGDFLKGRMRKVVENRGMEVR